MEILIAVALLVSLQIVDGAFASQVRRGLRDRELSRSL